MNWLKRLFHSLLGPDSLDEAPITVQQFHDFGDGSGPLPVITPSHTVRLHVTAEGGVLLDQQPIALVDLEPSLRAACTPETLVLYSRDNPDRDSPVAAEVIRCVFRLGLSYTIDDPRATTSLFILKCWKGFREALLREEEENLRQHCTEQVLAALTPEKRVAMRELCWEDFTSGKLSSMYDTDRDAMMIRKLQQPPQAGNSETSLELEVRFINHEGRWRVARIACAGLTVP